jgi:hypothetical protein
MSTKTGKKKKKGKMCVRVCVRLWSLIFLGESYFHIISDPGESYFHIISDPGESY